MKTSTLVAILSAMLLLCICAVFTVYQADRSQALEGKLDEGDEEIINLGLQYSLTSSRIERAKTVEFLTWLGGSLGTALVKIEPKSNFFVTEERI